MAGWELTPFLVVQNSEAAGEATDVVRVDQPVDEGTRSGEPGAAVPVFDDQIAPIAGAHPDALGRLDREVADVPDACIGWDVDDAPSAAIPVLDEGSVGDVLATRVRSACRPQIVMVAVADRATMAYVREHSVSYGPESLDRENGCTFVGIYDLNGDEWTTFFQS